METEEDERFQTQKVAESSMDVSALNNLVSSGKALFIAHLNILMLDLDLDLFLKSNDIIKRK